MSDEEESLTEEVEKGDGLAHKLLYTRKGTDGDLLTNLEQASKKLSDLLDEIRTGDGLIHDIVYNKQEQSVAELLMKINQTAENIRLASEAVAKGSGTIGALLVDSKLYDNLVEVTDGAKRSFILRQAIRSTLD